MTTLPGSRKISPQFVPPNFEIECSGFVHVFWLPMSFYGSPHSTFGAFNTGDATVSLAMTLLSFALETYRTLFAESLKAAGKSRKPRAGFKNKRRHGADDEAAEEVDEEQPDDGGEANAPVNISLFLEAVEQEVLGDPDAFREARWNTFLSGRTIPGDSPWYRFNSSMAKILGYRLWIVVEKTSDTVAPSIDGKIFEEKLLENMKQFEFAERKRSTFAATDAAKNVRVKSNAPPPVSYTETLQREYLYKSITSAAKYAQYVDVRRGFVLASRVNTNSAASQARISNTANLAHPTHSLTPPSVFLGTPHMANRRQQDICKYLGNAARPVPRLAFPLPDNVLLLTTDELIQDNFMRLLMPDVIKCSVVEGARNASFGEQGAAELRNAHKVLRPSQSRMSEHIVEQSEIPKTTVDSVMHRLADAYRRGETTSVQRNLLRELVSLRGSGGDSESSDLGIDLDSLTLGYDDAGISDSAYIENSRAPPDSNSELVEREKAFFSRVLLHAKSFRSEDTMREELRCLEDFWSSYPSAFLESMQKTYKEDLEAREAQEMVAPPRVGYIPVPKQCLALNNDVVINLSTFSEQSMQLMEVLNDGTIARMYEENRKAIKGVTNPLELSKARIVFAKKAEEALVHNIKSAKISDTLRKLINYSRLNRKTTFTVPIVDKKMDTFGNLSATLLTGFENKGVSSAHTLILIAYFGTATRFDQDGHTLRFNLAMLGRAEVSKSYVLDELCKLIPPGTYIVYTYASDKALASGADLCDALFVCHEGDDMLGDDKFKNAMRKNWMITGKVTALVLRINDQGERSTEIINTDCIASTLVASNYTGQSDEALLTRFLQVQMALEQGRPGKSVHDRSNASSLRGDVSQKRNEHFENFTMWLNANTAQVYKLIKVLALPKPTTACTEALLAAVSVSARTRNIKISIRAQEMAMATAIACVIKKTLVELYCLEGSPLRGKEFSYVDVATHAPPLLCDTASIAYFVVSTFIAQFISPVGDIVRSGLELVHKQLQANGSNFQGSLFKSIYEVDETIDSIRAKPYQTQHRQQNAPAANLTDVLMNADRGAVAGAARAPAVTHDDQSYMATGAISIDILAKTLLKNLSINSQASFSQAQIVKVLTMLASQSVEAMPCYFDPITKQHVYELRGGLDKRLVAPLAVFNQQIYFLRQHLEQEDSRTLILNIMKENLFASEYPETSPGSHTCALQNFRQAPSPIGYEQTFVLGLRVGPMYPHMLQTITLDGSVKRQLKLKNPNYTDALTDFCGRTSSTAKQVLDERNLRTQHIIPEDLSSYCIRMHANTNHLISTTSDRELDQFIVMHHPMYIWITTHVLPTYAKNRQDVSSLSYPEGWMAQAEQRMKDDTAESEKGGIEMIENYLDTTTSNTLLPSIGGIREQSVVPYTGFAPTGPDPFNNLVEISEKLYRDNSNPEFLARPPVEKHKKLLMSGRYAQMREPEENEAPEMPTMDDEDNEPLPPVPNTIFTAGMLAARASETGTSEFTKGTLEDGTPCLVLRTGDNKEGERPEYVGHILTDGNLNPIAPGSARYEEYTRSHRNAATREQD